MTLCYTIKNQADCINEGWIIVPNVPCLCQAFQPPKNSLVNHMAPVTCSSLVIHDPDDDDPDPVTGVSATVSPRVSL